MTSDMGEMFNDYRIAMKEKRASTRATSAAFLDREGIAYDARNYGAHLILQAPKSGTIDFWPGTGRWTVRASGKEKRGVCKLVNLFKREAK
jgi:hypothetical protein